MLEGMRLFIFQVCYHLLFLVCVVIVKIIRVLEEVIASEKETEK